jgi:hypothetical protein
MIHGEKDNYINLEIVERLFAWARSPKELWVVRQAKHNGCLDVAGDEYRRKTREFFLRHLGRATAAATTTAADTAPRAATAAPAAPIAASSSISTG